VIGERREKARAMKRRKPNIDRIFHALGDATRRAMVVRLSQGPMSVSRLAEPFEMSLAAVVQHLQVLEESGLVRTEKVGRVRTCSIETRGLSVAERWIDERRSLWEKRLDRLGNFLAEADEG
jgi:DNA-binding transcriptional ArsR family regulator